MNPIAAFGLIVSLLLIPFASASAACSRQHAAARLPASVPELGDYACPSSPNAASGNIVVSQDYEFDGVPLLTFFKQYRNELEFKGWAISGVRNAPLLHALLATNSQEGLTLEFSAREKVEGDQLIDVSKVNPRTLGAHPEELFKVNPNAKQFEAKLIIKRR